MQVYDNTSLIRIIDVRSRKSKLVFRDCSGKFKVDNFSAGFYQRFNFAEIQRVSPSLSSTATMDVFFGNFRQLLVSENQMTVLFKPWLRITKWPPFRPWANKFISLLSAIPDVASSLDEQESYDLLSHSWNLIKRGCGFFILTLLSSASFYHVGLKRSSP